MTLRRDHRHKPEAPMELVMEDSGHVALISGSCFLKTERHDRVVKWHDRVVKVTHACLDAFFSVALRSILICCRN